MSYLGKNYTSYKHENFEEFLKHFGFSENMIQEYIAAGSSQKLVKNGDTYTYISNSAEGLKETTFKSGVEFDDVMGKEKTPIKVTCIVDGDTVDEIIKSGNDITTLKYEYKDDEMVATITHKGWNGVAKQYFKA